MSSFDSQKGDKMSDNYQKLKEELSNLKIAYEKENESRLKELEELEKKVESLASVPFKPGHVIAQNIWIPANERYYSVDGCFDVAVVHAQPGDDTFIRRTINSFKTKEDAQKMARRFAAFVKLHKVWEAFGSTHGCWEIHRNIRHDNFIPRQLDIGEVGGLSGYSFESMEVCHKAICMMGDRELRDLYGLS